MVRRALELLGLAAQLARAVLPPLATLLSCAVALRLGPLRITAGPLPLLRAAPRGLVGIRGLWRRRGLAGGPRWLRRG
eukprot:7435581-Heterocapsa_arctica.AAC.1